MKTLARAVLLAMMLMSHHAWAEDEVTFHHRPVKAIADSRIAVGGQGELPLYISSDWSVPLPAITRAVLVLHGRLRNADVYCRSAKAAQAAAGATGNTTIMIVPQFLAGIDVEAYHLPAATLRWTLEGWEGGEPAVGPAPASSFDALDAILARLADRRLFPNLKQVVVAGHSGGGQVVQRYAIAGRADEQLIRENIGVRYVVANPSSLPISAPSGRSRRSRHPVRDLTTGNTAWSPVRFIWPRPRRMNWSGVTSRGNWSIFSARSTPTPINPRSTRAVWRRRKAPIGMRGAMPMQPRCSGAMAEHLVTKCGMCRASAITETGC